MAERMKGAQENAGRLRSWIDFSNDPGTGAEALEALFRRSDLERARRSLTPQQEARLNRADAAVATNASRICAALKATGVLAKMQHFQSSEQGWWWRLPMVADGSIEVHQQTASPRAVKRRSLPAGHAMKSLRTG